MRILRDCVVDICDDFSQYEVDEGYLVLKPGDAVHVECVGSDQEETGWFFGSRLGASDRGWFPGSIVGSIHTVVEVHTSFAEYGLEEGYLVLQPGDRVYVEFKGDGDELGWCFGDRLGSSDRGWFPEEIIAPSDSSTACPQPSLADDRPTIKAGAESVGEAETFASVQTESIFDSRVASTAAQVLEVKLSEATLAVLGSPPTLPLASAAHDTQPSFPPPPVPRRIGQKLPPQPPRPIDVEKAPMTAQLAKIALPSSIYNIELEGSQKLQPPGFHDRVIPNDVISKLQRGIDAGKDLPMVPLCETLCHLIETNRVVVIDAATGSGKSTLVPICLAKQCAEAGTGCRIVVTQPRRIAAKSLATRVSNQCGTTIGDLVGYRVGHDRQDQRALVVYVTVGHLLEALVHNPRHLDSFSHIVLDEVHERFVEADFLMALLRLWLSRPETTSVRLVVMSATLQNVLGHFFRPLLLPAPRDMQPAKLSLPGRTPHEVRDFLWEDIRKMWPNMFIAKEKEPNFTEMRPSKIRSLRPRRRSDHLTKFCRVLAPFCARLLIELREGSRDPYDPRGGVVPAARPSSTCTVTLVFCPGLDQMRELDEALKYELQKNWYNRNEKPNVFLMHSALDEEIYAGALDPLKPNEWRVVIATNLAESSLTVPGVNAVIDFGLHRINIYDDDTRMSVLATEWCSRASLTQRRGRTGRTNSGNYIRLFTKAILDELKAFDDSGVERSALTRITLEAAHMAQMLNAPKAVRAGLPVRVRGADADFIGIVTYWDGFCGGWRVTEKGGYMQDAFAYIEDDLIPCRLTAKDILDLLPSPPKESRVQAALTELHEVGVLTNKDEPSVMGVTCLKLPVDVPLGRLVVMSWALECPLDGIVLAAALSLAPSCDVLRTPFNTKNTLDKEDIKHLRESVELRRDKDKGSHSEPITCHSLCLEWLRNGSTGYHSTNLGGPPRNVEWASRVHPRLWTQFTEKVVELTESLLRLVPMHTPAAEFLVRALCVARGAPKPLVWEPVRQYQLKALLAWALAPLGFVALGQTPALYGGGAYDVFSKVVKAHKGDTHSSLWWPKIQESHLIDVVSSAACCVRWSDVRGQENFIGIDTKANLDLLFRLCGPFNGRETFISTPRVVSVKPPRHPCTMNWYMPRRDGVGMLEVRVNWKSQAETLLHVPRARDRNRYCRPKQFLVSSGGEYQSVGGRRTVMLRGATLLPVQDGGRSALMWLLAAGMPREHSLVALVAPSYGVASGGFELRAVRIWERTLCLPRGDPITSGDLRVVNSFRNSLLELQARRTHRLAGTWHERGGDGKLYYLECLDSDPCPSEGEQNGVETSQDEEEIMVVSDGRQVLNVLRSTVGERRWTVKAVALHRDGHGLVPMNRTLSEEYVDEDQDGYLNWSSGACWSPVLGGRDGQAPILSQFLPETIARFRKIAEKMLDLTDPDDAGGPAGGYSDSHARRWPGRLIPLRSYPTGSDAIAPFDLETVEEALRSFKTRLTERDVDCEEEEYERDRSSDDEGDELPTDVSQEHVCEEYLWRLAEEEDWGPARCRQLSFVESALALPPSPICVDCEKEGKIFSKSQLSKHPDERRCEDCIAKCHSVIYRAATPGMALNGGLPVKAQQQKSTLTPTAASFVMPLAMVSGGRSNPNVSVCSSCGIPLNKANCSASQKGKEPKRRKCMSCVNSGA